MLAIETLKCLEIYNLRSFVLYKVANVIFYHLNLYLCWAFSNFLNFLGMAHLVQSANELVLMQRTSQSGGMGAALGGGAAESAFGSDTNNVLTKSTIYSTIAFFVVALGLFLIYQSRITERNKILDPIELIGIEKTEPVADAKPVTDAETITGADSVADSLEALIAEGEESVEKVSDKNVEATKEAASSTDLEVLVNDVEQQVAKPVSESK